MIHFIFACLLATSQLTTVVADCNACISNVCHERRLILDGFEQIGQIAIDRNSNIFYFYVKHIKKNRSYTVAYDLDNVQLYRIMGSDFTFARTVDPSTRDIYMSRETSVYKTNPNNNFTEGETLFDGSVWHMQFSNKLYYTEFNSNGIKVYENNLHKSVEGLSQYKIDDFVIDKNNDIYFMSDFTVYKLRNGEKEAKLFAEDMYSLTTDKFGEVYLIQPFTRGIFKVDYGTGKMLEIGAFSEGIPFKAVFTSDNYIIYSDSNVNVMYLLVPGNGVCRVSLSENEETAAKTISIEASPKQ